MVCGSVLSLQRFNGRFITVWCTVMQLDGGIRSSVLLFTCLYLDSCAIVVGCDITQQL